MQSLKGHFLIAAPHLDTPVFARSVILMLDHNQDGAMGLILNQPINTLITDLAGRIFEEGFEWDKPLHLGGPVPGSLIVLHTLESLGDHEIIPGVFVTLEASSVQQIIRQRPNPRWSSPIIRVGARGSSKGSSTGIPGSHCPLPAIASSGRAKKISGKLWLVRSMPSSCPNSWD